MPKLNWIFTVFVILSAIALFFCEYTLLVNDNQSYIHFDGQSGAFTVIWGVGKTIFWPITVVIFIIHLILTIVRRKWKDKYTIINLALLFVLSILWTYSPELSIFQLWRQAH